MSIRVICEHPGQVPGAPQPKPFRIGMNHAKRVARAHDERDRILVLKMVGPCAELRAARHHQSLVKQRHAYYADVYEGEERERDQRAAYTIAAFDDARQHREDTGDADRAVPEPASGPDPS